MRVYEEGQIPEGEEQAMKEREITMYMRFKKELKKDDDGADMHIDFLMEKFKREFDS